MNAAALHRCDVERVLHILVDTTDVGRDVLVGMTRREGGRKEAYTPR